MSPQEAYDALALAKAADAAVRDAIRDSKESCAPRAAAQEEYEAARETLKAENQQWEAANQQLLEKRDETKAVVRATRETFDEVALNAYTRGEQLSLFEAERPIRVTFTTKLKVEKVAPDPPVEEEEPAAAD